MRIVKPGYRGRIDPEYMFQCFQCGCEFIENASECKVEDGQYTDFYYVKPCPFCESLCHSSTKLVRRQDGKGAAQ